jgi:hypothetical protein
MVQALRSLKAKRFILDGELTIPVGKILSFKEQMRLHLAASLVTKLAAAPPSLLTVFDMLETARGADLTAEPLRVRPAALEKFMAALAPSVFLRLSPAATRRVDADRAAPTKKVKALIGKPGFTGDKPGGPSRWSTERSAQWQPPDEADG